MLLIHLVNFTMQVYFMDLREPFTFLTAHLNPKEEDTILCNSSNYWRCSFAISRENQSWVYFQKERYELHCPISCFDTAVLHLK